MEKPSRRLFLAAGPATAVFGALGVAKAADVIAPPTMQMLGRELERLWAIENHALAMGACGEIRSHHDDDFDAAAEAAGVIVDRICAMPAKTIEDFNVKSRALLWCHSGEYSDLFEGLPQNNTVDVKVARSILRDMLAAANG
jgi:hypothetical protein